MAKKISELAELTSIATDDYIPVVDTSDTATKRISSNNLLKSCKAVVLYDDTTGTTSNVQFNGLLTQYKYIEIFFYKGGNYGSTKIEVSKSKGQIFKSIDYSSANTFQLYSQDLQLSQSAVLPTPTIQISRGTGRYINLITDGSNAIGTGTENTIYIYKVLGWY